MLDKLKKAIWSFFLALKDAPRNDKGFVKLVRYRQMIL